MTSGPAPIDQLDVAVVGGGVSGLYAAWRLCTQDPSLRVAVFELADAVGGRLKNYAFPQAPGVTVALGGISYSDSHRIVSATVSALNLPLRSWQRRRANDILFLRGRALRRRRMKRRLIGPLAPFALPRSVQVRGPMPTLVDAAERLVPGAASLTRADWQALHEAGSPLASMTYRDALATVLSEEHLVFLAGRSGISHYVDAPSALHGLEWLLLQAKIEKPMLVPEGGFQRLALALAEAVRSAGMALHTRHRVVGLDAAENGVTMRVRPEQVGGEAVISARKVILAMPRAAIEAIESFPARDAPRSQLKRLLSTVEPYAFGQIILLYPRAWWDILQLGNGYSASDLPMGHVTFHVDPAAGPEAPAVARMTFDSEAVPFWRNLAEPPEGGFVKVGPDAPLAREARRQMQAMFGSLLRAPIPEPLDVAFQDWSSTPFGGAVHQWSAGADAGRSAEAMLKPLDGVDLFVCGEAWSHNQGWVEGALERADAVLSRWFDVPPLAGATSG